MSKIFYINIAANIVCNHHFEGIRKNEFAVQEKMSIFNQLDLLINSYHFTLVRSERNNALLAKFI